MADSEYKQSSLYVQSIGITDGVLEGWMKRGLEKGIHYIVVGHQTLIHVRRADQWLSERGQLASDHRVEAYEFASGETGKSSTPRRSKAIHSMRVISPLRSGAGTN